MLELIIAAVVIGLDQLTKYLTDLYLSPLGTSYPLWEGVFHFTSAHNTGAAFSLLSGARWLFVGVTLCVAVAAVWLLIKKRDALHPLFRASVALIVSGAVGNNLIDRLFLGYVRDMLDFCLIDFAVFNVADMAVCIGAGLLAIDVLFTKKGRALMDLIDDKPKKKPAGEPADDQ